MANVPTPEEQLALLVRGAVEVFSEEELLAKLRAGRPLRVKLGLDPTAPDLHIGNAIVLRKMRQFQDLGHEAIIVIGDFTALIGDPSGKKETRPALSPEDVARNADTYAAQYDRILDRARTRVVFNSEWLAPLSFEDLIRIASRATVAQVLERDDFETRWKGGAPIHLHELLYPIAQAYDSVHLQADVELGGTDQKFNNLMGRNLQREFGQAPQVVLLTPLLVGLDGVQKMSKSLGNAIGITEPPAEQYGKVMSIPDDRILHYLEFATDVPSAVVEEVRRSLDVGENPRDAKRMLAREIVRAWHGGPAAASAEADFDRVFGAKELPEQIPEVLLPRSEVAGPVRLVRLLVLAGMAESNSEARRLIAQGGVTLDGKRISDVDRAVAIAPGMVLRVGRRRFARLVVR